MLMFGLQLPQWMPPDRHHALFAHTHTHHQTHTNTCILQTSPEFNGGFHISLRSQTHSFSASMCAHESRPFRSSLDLYVFTCSSNARINTSTHTHTSWDPTKGMCVSLLYSNVCFCFSHTICTHTTQHQLSTEMLTSL